MPSDRRSPTANTLLMWVSIVGGVLVLTGTLVGAGISYGQHLRADAEQDARIKTLEERVRDLEHADVYQHGEMGLLPHAPKGTER